MSLSQYNKAGPPPITPSEFSAVDSIHAAMLALNAAQAAPDVDSYLAWQRDATSPMSLIAEAGRSALALLIVPQGMTASDAALIWDGMISNGCSAQYNYELLRRS